MSTNLLIPQALILQQIGNMEKNYYLLLLLLLLLLIIVCLSSIRLFSDKNRRYISLRPYEARRKDLNAKQNHKLVGFQYLYQL